MQTGFLVVESVIPSPPLKSHSHDRAPVERSVNWTVRGETQLVMFDENPASGSSLTVVNAFIQRFVSAYSTTDVRSFQLFPSRLT